MSKPEVVDLMAALEASLRAAKSTREPDYCCLTLEKSGTCGCPDREQNIGR